MFVDNIWDITQIIWLDLVLSADNAILIALAAGNVPLSIRKRVILLGITVAVIARIIFAIAVTYLLAIKGLLFAGGLMLAWITWRLYKDIRKNDIQSTTETDQQQDSQKNHLSDKETESTSFFDPTVRRAIFSILIADISMSIDNVITVAAIARDNIPILVFGLAFSIVVMAFASNLVVKLIEKYYWISYVGIAFLTYLSAKMLWEGWNDVALLIQGFFQ